MKRIPMMLQLTLIMFFVMAIPMTILTWYSGKEILQYSENAIASSTLAGLDANRRLNENALGNLSQNVVRLATTRVFDLVRYFKTFDEATANYNNVSDTQAVLSELINLNSRVDGAYSSFFYLNGSNYVISTDKGITMLDQYEPLDWMQEALVLQEGISGIWHARALPSGRHVVSYVLPLNRLNTTTQGVIVVNMLESQIGEYLRTSEPGRHGYMLMEADGTIISHNDKSLLLTDGRQQPFIEDILQISENEGYEIYEVEGNRLIYTWSRSELLNGWNINIYSMDELMSKALSLQRSIIILTAVIILAGAFLTVFLATWLSRPIRELVRAIRTRSNPKISNKNELVFLDEAFRRMQEEEEELYKLLKEREQENRSLAIYNMLRGEVAESIKEIFPLPDYCVAVVSIDRYRSYVNKTNPKTRDYHRHILISKSESLFPDSVHVRCVYHGDGNFVIVVNYCRDVIGSDFEEMKKSLILIRNMAVETLDYSVTIGISSQSDDSVIIPDQLAEALESIKHRMIEGSGGITFWKDDADRKGKYIDPANNERRILNFLDKGDLDSIIKELELIRNEIYSAEYISYDNILFIYNQLVGVTIKHLREKSISTARIFMGQRNVYSAIASIDTLDELEEYLHKFFGEIIQYLALNSGENYSDRIIRYIQEHYCEEIVFEDMAKEIGISYSYMRRITFEVTGKSLIDYTNMLRIEKAKMMLLESDLTNAQIASEVGYYNVQSFYRFFRKYEGMPPSSYKAMKQESKDG